METDYRGRPFQIMADGIYFPDHRTLFSVDQAELWQPGLPAALPDAAPLRRERIGALVDRLRSRLSSSPFCEHLAHLTGIQIECPKTNPLRIDGIEKIIRGLRLNEIDQVIIGVQSLLGYGPGLTPSGDDVVTGMLLGLSRYPRSRFSGTRDPNDILPEMDVEEMIQKINPIAARATTLLSRNILANAARGWADERLIFSLDGIMTGFPDVDTCARYLAMWGSSSGIDSLVGMTLAVWGE
ncbi:MAG: DUF2877 domain-containing protein [Chloroflexi bacterium]|nr:MAG: DUF2877 domain-containing protein [Chloroflexota bacterium]